LTETSRFVELSAAAALTLWGVMPRGTDRRLDRNEAGLTREGLSPGAEKLLAELAMRGLKREAVRDAALLAVALDENPTSPRSEEAAA
jgi:hypothetical protein